MTRERTAGWHIDAGDEWRQPRVLDWSGKVVAVLPEESELAPLIAAAPDMLAALKDLLDAYANEVPYANDPDDPDCPRAARKAYAAISRAESTALSGQT